MAALQRTLAFAQVNEVAVLIAQDLDFDVTGTLDEFLQVHLAGAKGTFGFAGCAAQSSGEILGVIHSPHTFSAAAGSRFEQDGIPDFRGKLQSFAG